MNVETRSAEFWERLQAAADEALHLHQTDSDRDKTARAILAARWVPEAAARLGLTEARYKLEDRFKVSERTIRRFEIVALFVGTSALVRSGRVSLDTASKIMKTTGADALTIAWETATLDARTEFLAQNGLMVIPKP